MYCNAPGTLKIKLVTLDKPYARVTIKKDKTTNINDVIISSKDDKKKAAAKKTGSVKKSASPFVYQIDKIKVSKACFLCRCFFLIILAGNDNVINIGSLIFLDSHSCIRLI
jgi:hypothetical protein